MVWTAPGVGGGGGNGGDFFGAERCLDVGGEFGRMRERVAKDGEGIVGIGDFGRRRDSRAREDSVRFRLGRRGGDVCISKGDHRGQSFALLDTGLLRTLCDCGFTYNGLDRGEVGDMEQVVLGILAIVGILAIASVINFVFARRNDGTQYVTGSTIFAAVASFVAVITAFVITFAQIFSDSSDHAPAPSALRPFAPDSVDQDLPGAVGPNLSVPVTLTAQTYDPRTALLGLEGIAPGLGPNEELWVVLRGQPKGQFFPAPAPCTISSEGRFSCQQIPTGTLSSATPKVNGLLVVAGPEASIAFRRYSSGLLGKIGFERLPGDAVAVKSIAVGS